MNKRPFWILGGVLGLMWGCGGQPAKGTKTPDADAQVPMAPIEPVGTRVFTGPEGLRYDVVELADGGALVKVSGVRSELNGKVFRAEGDQDGRYFRYRVDWHGRTLNMLVRQDTQSGTSSWHAYVPDAARDGYAIEYSEKLSPSVDVEAMKRDHIAQTKSGELAKIQDFDRAAEEADAMASLEEEGKRTASECGKATPMSVVWSTVSDAELLEKNVAGYCSSLYSGLRNVCRTDVGKAFVASQVKGATCRFDGASELKLDGNTLNWAISFATYNLDQKANEALRQLEVGGASVQERILDEETRVCTDPSGEYVVMVGPREAPHRGMAYGRGKKLQYVNAPELLGGDWFFDPRQKNEKNNPEFRGYDLRFFSQVKADPEKGTCVVMCGAREIPMRLLTGDAKAAALRDVEFTPSPLDREPYALARDRQGTYYYVDRGMTPESAKDFHLYRGKRGKMKPLAMRDVVSDSEGEIFASETGKLRLIVGRDEAQWIASKQPQKLLRLPLGENYGLIYNELGMFLGERFGVPCDDL